jgi:hypothetical protein|tara:strand:- start:229 stop:480 length:252 start_codon:yes stop_codon:yes gene_type:complete
MNNQELIKQLNKLKVDPKYYAIGGELKDNAHNVERLYNGTYAVYYLERGEKCGLKIFDTESEANIELLNSIKFDIENGLDLSQ